ncbi:MAG: ATP-grasp domain-containing protein [Candidatus Lokiarchaeota archaeon]|nr:ATP-grasp domain-containing protein [Candidatus Lokiarchaeota archaeon]
MADESNSVLVVGFNTRPLVYSLNKAGYSVYAVDFFGDLDLYPYVDDSIIVMKQLRSNYNSLKDKYSKYLAQFALVLHRKYRDVKYLLIGSGLDNAYVERELIFDEIKNFGTINVNNNLITIKKSRDIEYLLGFLKSNGYKVPTSYSFEEFQLQNLKMEYPFIFKKKRSAGGTNVFKIENEMALASQIKILEKKIFIPTEWLIQEYIEGIPVSCTVISNRKVGKVISINRQIIGEKFLNSPKKFMYCGNIVPAGISEDEERIISEISILLTRELGLKGINGFDFVLKDNYPYFMECNPRIPGSIRASELVLNLNLLDLHIKSFIPNEWENIKNLIKSAKPKKFATKLVFFAPKDIEKNILPKINSLEFVHDKCEPIKNVLKGEPLCTILYGGNSLLESYNGAKNIVIEINKIIE